MASTYSTSLKLELIGTGDQSGTWGATTNNNLGTLLEQAIVGQSTIVMVNADYTLSNVDGATDQARNAAIIITGTQSATFSVICPAVQKLYMITNNLSSSATAYFKPSGGTAISIANGNTILAYCTGTTMVPLNYTDKAGTANISGGVASQIPYQTAANTTSFIANGTSGQVLKSNGATVPTWVDQSTLAAGTAALATASTNIAGGIASQIPYQTGANATGFIANGTSGQVLQSNGASVPSWTSQSALTVGSATNIAGGAANQINYQTGSGVTSFITAPTTFGTALTWNGSAFTWGTPSATVASGCIYENGQTITANYTMTTGNNGQSAGPITIDTGVTVTIPTDSYWVIN
jgi:hypothetical protein